MRLPVTCPFCGVAREIEVDAEAFAAYANGSMIQDAFAGLTAGQREEILTGSHEACFDRAFREDDDVGGW